MKLPGHKWHLDGEVVIANVRYFQYVCGKCPATTLNGKPIPAPFNETCGKPK